MLSITHTMATRDQVWTAFRRTPDVRLRERYHSILLRMDGKNYLEVAQWLYRDEELIRLWVHALNEAGLCGWEQAAIPWRPTLTPEPRAQVKEAVRRCPSTQPCRAGSLPQTSSAVTHGTHGSAASAQPSMRWAICGLVAKVPSSRILVCRRRSVSRARLCARYNSRSMNVYSSGLA